MPDDPWTSLQPSIVHCNHAATTDPFYAQLLRKLAQICATPIALLITFTDDVPEIQANYDWPHTQLPVSRPFIEEVRLHEGFIEVVDISDHARAQDLPQALTPPRYFAGLPICVNDQTIGILCLLDYRPNKLNLKQQSIFGIAANELQHYLAERQDIEHIRDESNTERLATDIPDSRLKRFYENFTDPLAYWDTKMVCVYYNRPFAQWFDLPYPFERRLSLLEVVGKDHFHDYLKVLELALSGHSTSLEDRRSVNSDDFSTMLDLQLSADIDEDNTVLGTVMFGHQAADYRSLNHHKTFLAAIVDSSNDAIISKTPEGLILTWNRAAERIFGYTAKEVIGKPVLRLFPPERIHEEAMLMQRVLRGEPIRNMETQRLRKDGQLIDLSISVSPIYDDQGKVIGISKIARDISHNKHIERALNHQHERLRITMNAIGEGVVTTDQHGVIDYINPVAENLLGQRLHEVLGHPVAEVMYLINDESRAPVVNPILACLADREVKLMDRQTILINQLGREIYVEDSAAPIIDNQHELIGAVMVFRDVTADYQQNKEMNYQATHDALTGLINRREFEVRLQSLLSQVSDQDARHTLLYIDLDHFKLVNDTCGHAVGDQLLKQVVGLMASCMRDVDTLARLGGDEFAVLLEHCDFNQGMRVAQQICERVGDFRFVHDNQQFRVGTSIGLVVIDKHWSDLQALVQAADASCYAAKEAGRHRVHVYQESEQQADHRRGDVNLINELEYALNEERFTLYWQQIMPVKQQSGIHGEVLLRLKGLNDHETLQPASFLPAAERFHMISRIDRWVIRHVLQWMQQHRAELSHLTTLSVNISGQSLDDLHFQKDLLELVSHSQCDLTTLCFEITETAAITNLARTATFIENMRKLGVRFSLDDFGTGISSFGYLKNLQVDFLKIDGLFIENLAASPLDQATVRCISEIAKICHIQTIAEYVQNDEVQNLLIGFGIDYVQGFLRHRPAPLDELLTTLH